MFNYKYLTKEHLKGFDNYKYNAIDTSPLSRYVMHPTWNFSVKFIPKWIAPNVLTFAGFLCMVLCALIVLAYDYDCTASGRPGENEIEESILSRVVFTVCAFLIFIAYNLDGMDGKQARRLGLSGPLGELFDHGLDSYIVFLIPYCLISVFGRDQYSTTVFRAYLIVMSIVLNFYVSHWEKYNTGTLYLPWGYDLSMWASSLLFLLAGIKGPAVYKVILFGNVKFVDALEMTIHATGLFTTLPVAIYNVYLSYKNKTGHMYSLPESLRPIWGMLIMTVTMTVWVLCSPNDILEKDPRMVLLAFGTLFSNISSRLIVAEMSEQRCDTISWINIPLITAVVISFYLPQFEITALYVILVFAVAAHVHYGVCVVRQMCEHFKINCFIVPKEKRK
ncbi:ethanolaminephosphotransferase 1-like isoform X1 [Nymphalis io]|uniref:ethanolaminephosphotransferase 1-like isoform X1 n=2 Tax=Inachis io TaxID=171585 RepID=UPI002169D5D9|nr:ethanolaminephosphotransferase 1-like isoform X1 [Nymphalis io]